jgi:hypothetical protein
MSVPAFGRLARWQAHGVHNPPDDIPPQENAFVREEMKTFLSPVEDYAASRRSLILDLDWHCASALEPCPVVDVASGMRHGGAVGFRIGKWRGVDDEPVAKEPEDADAGLRINRVAHCGFASLFNGRSGTASLAFRTPGWVDLTDF